MVVLALCGVGVAVSALAAGDRAVGVVGVSTPSAASSGPGSTTGRASGTVFVHLLGRVARPGLYEVPADARAVDVVSAAGGFTADADQAALNLARGVSDGEQIVVPKVGEAPASGSSLSPAAPGSAGSSSSGVVDLNTADAAALESLSGVGPATSAAILAWRDEHGRFEAVEDLLDVRGIGEKKLEALREAVRV